MSEQILLLREIEAAKRYGFSRKWFQKMRLIGGGPPHLKIGCAVRYEVARCDSWFKQNSNLGAASPDAGSKDDS